MKWTLKNLAEELKISRTTVSLVLQGKGDQYRISKQTQDKIKKFAHNKGYKPNYFATALSKKESGTIGVIFPDVFEDFMSHMVRGIEVVLYSEGYTMMLSTSLFRQNREIKIMKDMLYRGIDGLLLVPTMNFITEGLSDFSHITGMGIKSSPMVLIDRSIPDWPGAVVLQKDRQRSHEGLLKLKEQGYRRISCISLNLEADTIQRRLSGYYDFMKEEDQSPDVILINECNAESHDLLNSLLERKTSADAWFVTTSGLAEKLHWLLNNTEGLTPAPIARFGNSPGWRQSPFTDINQPHQIMGTEAAKILIKQIKGDKEAFSAQISC